MRLPKPLAAVLSLSVVALAGAAEAQSNADENSGYSYHFDDDLMVGDTFDSPPPLLKMGHRIHRIPLLRPRASFVADMLKSVETL